MNYAKKSFSVQMRSAESKADLDERWRQTFGVRMANPPAVITPDPPPVRPPAVTINGLVMVPLVDVTALLEREAVKARANGDTVTAELWDLARAKMKIFER